MRKNLGGLFSQSLCIRHTGGILIIFLFLNVAHAQEKTLDGKIFTAYKRSHFTPKRGLYYTLYLSPLVTVDPLGLGGKSTYALGAGTQIRLWESRTPDKALQGLRIKGWYTAAGYEYYPNQYDNIYGSLWLRVKTFMPITARIDGVYSFGYGMQGVSTRYCFGFEIKKFTVLLCGSIYRYSTSRYGFHPFVESQYTNAGAIMLVVPVYEHQPKR
ncbi:MAG: hypothetical protein ACOYXT_23725 [Bacteroidota bacterium]